MNDDIARTWYAQGNSIQIKTCIDITGITAKNGTLNSINVPSYSNHLWFTIGY